jgi:hypothetical protein
MTFRSRIKCLLLATACAYQALAINPIANCQASTAVSPSENIQSMQQAPSSDDGLTKQGQPSWPGRFRAYTLFIEIIGRQDIQGQNSSQQDKGSVPKKANYAEIIGIREDEEQAMRTILMDAFYRVRENDRQFSALNEEAHRANDVELGAKRDALGKLRSKIYDDAISKLRQELGEESFTKVDAYLYMLVGGGKRDGSYVPYPAKEATNPGKASGAQR